MDKTSPKTFKTKIKESFNSLSDTLRSYGIYRKLFKLVFKAQPVLATAYILIRSLPEFMGIYWSWFNGMTINIMMDAVTKDIPVDWTRFAFFFMLGTLIDFFFRGGGYISAMISQKFFLEFSRYYEALFVNMRLKAPVMVLEHPDVADAFFKVKKRVDWSGFMRRLDELIMLLSTATNMAVSYSLLYKYYPQFVWLGVFTAFVLGIYRVYTGRMFNRLFEAIRSVNRLASWGWFQVVGQHAKAVELKALGVYKYMAQKFIPLSTLYQSMRIEFMKKDRKLTYPTVHLTTIFYQSYVFFRLMLDVVAKRVALGNATFYRGLALNSFNAMTYVFSMLGELQQDVPYYQLFFDLIEGKVYQKAYNDYQKMFNVNIDPQYKIKELRGADINIKDLRFRYKSSKTDVLKGINLNIKYGQNVAIVGPNGAGKSTLIKILMGLYPFYNGSVKYADKELRLIDTDTLIHNISYLPQEVVKFQYLTPYELITLDKNRKQVDNKLFDYKTFNAVIEKQIGQDIKTLTNKILKKEITSAFKEVYIKNTATKVSPAVINAAKKAYAHDFIQKYPLKYFTLLSATFEGGVEPSLGQWQRMHLARVFYTPLDVLILDEPTSAVDPQASFAIMDTIFDTFKEQTVIIISHRYATIMNADYVYVLDDGKIIEQGTPKQLVDANGYFAKAYNEEINRLKKVKGG